jgi:alpha-glucosidase
MLDLRNRHPALRGGALIPVETPHELLAFERVEGDERLLCAFNLGGDTIEWTPAGWTPIVSTGSIDGGTIGAWSGMIARRG